MRRWNCWTAWASPRRARRGLSALVIKPRSVADAYRLRAALRTEPSVALFPAEVLLRLYNVLGDVQSLLSGMAWLAQAAVLSGVLMAVFASLPRRRATLAVLRAQGAPRGYGALALWLEMALLLALGGLLGRTAFRPTDRRARAREPRCRLFADLRPDPGPGRSGRPAPCRKLLAHSRGRGPAGVSGLRRSHTLLPPRIVAHADCLYSSTTLNGKEDGVRHGHEGQKELRRGLKNRHIQMIALAGAFSHFAYAYWGEFPGFLSGWNYWFLYVAVSMTELSAVGIYVNYWLPDFPQWLSAFLALAGVTTVNLIQVRLYGELEFWFALVKVAAVIGMIGLGAVLVLLNAGHDPQGADGPGFANLWAHGGFFPHSLSGMLLSLVLVMFSFGGTALIAVSAGEADNPKKTCPRPSVRCCAAFCSSISARWR